MPMFSEDFRKWLQSEKHLSSSKCDVHMLNLQKADEMILDEDHDFWLLINKAWRCSDFDRVKQLCKEYESILLKNKEVLISLSEEERYESPAKIEKWIKTFRSYVLFIESRMKNADIENRITADMIEMSRASAKKLPLAFSFMSWGMAQGKEKSSMQSAVSIIKGTNKKLFCKTCYDLFNDYLTDFINNRDIANINEMFNSMIGKLNERINEYDETELNLDTLKRARKALSLYRQFIISHVTK